MLKFIKNEKGEALTIFLIGLMFTMIVAAKEASNLRVELKECKAPLTVSLNIDK